MVDPMMECVVEEVRIEPAAGHQISIPFGGPLWEGHSPPEFVYHIRDGRPAMFPVHESDLAPDVIFGPVVWGGYAAQNFGNFLAEYVPRLAASVARHPDGQFLFLLPHDVSAARLKSWFWETLDWFGISRAQVLFCGAVPVVVSELHVFPQGEYMGAGGAPSEAYLDLLDSNARARGLGDKGDNVVYVSRAGLGDRSLGGEIYVEGVLDSVGVKTVRPETLVISEQLSWYMRARTLIFAEGSAVHGRQLLGRRAGSEAVLVRRRGQRFCRRALEPRCGTLHYLDTLDASVHFFVDSRTGRPTPYNAFPLLNAGRIISSFSSLGVDLSPSWSDREFYRQLESDLDSWATAVCSRASAGTLVDRMRLMEGSLYGCGKQKYVARLAEIATAAASG